MSKIKEKVNKIWDFIETHITDKDEYPKDLYDYLEDFIDLEKAIEILKNKFELFIFESNNIYYIANEYAVGQLSQEEYELLYKMMKEKVRTI